MKIFGLDIPLGLEDLFSKIFRPAVLGVTDVIFTKKNLANTRVYRQFAYQSYFVIFQNTYKFLSQSRKNAWTAFWGSLPFGGHYGAGGWPGSGFSAFVYINGPRYKLGQSILLDPPFSLGDELCTNNNFALNADGWNLEIAYWDAGNIRIDSVDDAYYGFVYQEFAEGLENAHYYVQIYATIPVGLAGQFGTAFTEGNHVFVGGLATGGGSNFYLGVWTEDTGGVPVILSKEVNYNNDPTENGFMFAVDASGNEGPILIHAVSLRKII